jgi:hypothetical protein
MCVTDFARAYDFYTTNFNFKASNVSYARGIQLEKYIIFVSYIEHGLPLIACLRQKRKGHNYLPSFGPRLGVRGPSLFLLF